MTDNQLKITLVPLDIAWGDIEENIATTAKALRKVPSDTDLVVLPEMFTTGFITEPTLLTTIDSETTEKTLAIIRRWADSFQFAICGSIVACVGNKLFNRAFFIEPSGDESFYDKRHLFSMGGEARTFTPGDRIPEIIRYRGFNIRMSVCYDLRFPVWNRNVECGYDLLIFPANWPDSRVFAWKTLLAARAIENQAFVVGCNRTGSDDFGVYSRGNSIVLNDWGDNIGTDTKDGLVNAILDLSKLEHNRRKFACWRDADSFDIEI